MARAPHPIVEELLPKLLDAAQQSIVVRDDDLKALTAKLIALGPTPALAAAVIAVLELATFIETDLKSPTVAHAVVVATRPTLALLQQAGSAGAEAVARLDDAGKKFDEFRGEAAAAKTPITPKAPAAGEVRAGPMARFNIKK